MIKVKDWGPFGIADVARRSVRVAYRRLRRADCIGEATRLRQWFADDYQRDLAEIIVQNLHKPEVIEAPARQVLRQLAAIVARRHLQAEIGYRTKRGN